MCTHICIRMQHFGEDCDEPVHASTVGVFLLSIFMMCIPFALNDTEAGKANSILFISLPPDGNQTVANTALITGVQPGVVVFEFGNYTWVHIICGVTGLEALLLWAKLCKISNNTTFTYSNIFRIGGLHTANNEFWAFVGFYHVILIMLLLSPISLHALVLFVWCIVSTMSTICEPGEDHEDDSPRSEVYCNRIAAVCCYIFISGVLFVIDGRMNRTIVDNVPSLNIDLLFMQFVVDTLLVVTHMSVQVQITTCYYARLVYTFLCGGVVVYFLVSGQGNRY